MPYLLTNMRRRFFSSENSEKLAAGTVFDFNYTGTVQSIDLPKGRYKLQCWGAQGGSEDWAVDGTIGSKGGYSEGVLNLNTTTTIYAFVGGWPGRKTGAANPQTGGGDTLNGGWNGGGASREYTRTWGDINDPNDFCSWPRPGGGATDFALVSSNMGYVSGRTKRSSASLLSRFIVAGGGAGSCGIEKEDYNQFTVLKINSTASSNDSSSGLYYKVSSYAAATPGTRYYAYMLYPSPSPKMYIDFYDADKTRLVRNTFTGIYDGQIHEVTAPESTAYVRLLLFSSTKSTVRGILRTYDGTFSTEYHYSSTGISYGGGLSGGGKYPGTQSSAGASEYYSGAFGLGANQTDGSSVASGAGGGGWYGGASEWIDSYTNIADNSGGGSGFVNIPSNDRYRPSGYTGLELESGQTIAGNESFPSPSGGTERGHSGNGFARITVI